MEGIAKTPLVAYTNSSSKKGSKWLNTEAGTAPTSSVRDEKSYEQQSAKLNASN